MQIYDATGKRVGIRRPDDDDCDEFISLIQASQSLHQPWVDFAQTRERFEAYLRSRQAPTDDGFFLCDLTTGQIAGVVNLNCVVHGFFHSAYLGYGIGAPFAGRGYMTEGLQLVIDHAFGEMKLHRLEANIQPENTASIALVRKCGFRNEGFSPRYLKIQGEWRDHERWAILADDRPHANTGARV